MIRVLLDQGLPRNAAALLRDAGWDAQHVGERDMARASDSAILDAARHESRVVITLDADFHALMALSDFTTPSVLRIREEGLRGQDIAALIQRIFNLCDSPLRSGALITYASGKLRIKHLPIAK